jgi:hypothetical protein
MGQMQAQIDATKALASLAGNALWARNKHKDN